MTHQVLARKWRPRCFQEIVGQSTVVQALTNSLNRQQLHHAYLFTGTRGVGKTTISRILTKCLNCEKGISANPCNVCENCLEIDTGRFPDLFEVDAASRTKVEDTRELLDNIPYSPTRGRFKIYLIDEVHMLSGHSFNALLKTLEEPPRHVKFILATTDHHKLPITILSRCLQFHLTPLLTSQISTHCQHLLREEEIEFESAALDLLAQAANGSIRDALSLLDQGIAYGNRKILTEDIKTMLGIIEPTLLFDILDALVLKSGNHLFNSIHKLTQQGASFSTALADLLSLLHEIAIIQALPDAPIANDNHRLRKLAKSLNPEDVQLFYQIGLMGQRDLPYSPTTQIGFEMTLLRMLAFYPDTQKLPTPIITSTSSSIPTTSTLTTAISEEKKHDVPWNKLLTQLNLTGATLALAQQCSFEKITETELFLTLSPKQKPLLQQKLISRINEALCKHFNRPITARINISNDHQNETPMVIAKREALDRRLAAQKALLKDQQVQRIMQNFDAKLIEESVIPQEEGTEKG